MTDSTLSTFQHEILEEFFGRERGFFLTGGAALAGYHLGHRTTDDLDLFTVADLLREGEAAVRAAAEDLGAQVERIQSSPDFVRLMLRREREAVVIDLVRERAVQGDREKQMRGRVRIDSPEEILANKLCAILSRAEIRDIVDVLALERTGVDLLEALDLARRKDSGLTPAQLAWVLSQTEIGDDARIPGGFQVVELRDYVAELQSRLRALAFPPQR